MIEGPLVSFVSSTNNEGDSQLWLHETDMDGTLNLWTKKFSKRNLN